MRGLTDITHCVRKFFSFLIVVAIVLGATSTAFAQKYWTGNGSGYWTPYGDADNWNDKSGGVAGYFFLYESYYKITKLSNTP